MQFTKHARHQLERRGITVDEVAMALFYGERFESDGRLVYALGEGCGNYPERLPWSLRGLVVVVTSEHVVVTAYRYKRPRLRAYCQAMARRCATAPCHSCKRTTMSRLFAKLNALPLSVAAFRNEEDPGLPPFVVLSKSRRKKDGEGYEFDKLMLYAAEVPAVIRMLQRIEEQVLAID